MNDEMRLETRRLEDIKPYWRNPRVISDDAVGMVAASIRQCGYCAPIIIDENGVILAGHTRYKALLSLGWDAAPVVVKDDLMGNEKRKYRILDNRANEFSYWSYEKLERELDGLDFEDVNFGFGFLSDAMDAMDDDMGGVEYSTEDLSDEKFKHECPECGFRFN